MPSEGNAIGASIGSYLASDRIACVYMQNSGLGNAINPLTSICAKSVYNIPVILIVGHRGKTNINFIDEPQHKFMGQVTKKILSSIKIKHVSINNKTKITDIEKYLKSAIEKKSSLCFLVERNSFSDGKKDENKVKKKENLYEVNRKLFFEIFINYTNKNDLIISSTGYNSRELYLNKISNKISTDNDFYCIGGMGHTFSISSILAHKIKKRVFCIDGDGSILMHLGSLSNIKNIKSSNFIHFCLNNNSHESVGGQRITNTELQFTKIAKHLGFEKTIMIANKKQLLNFFKKMSRLKGKIFVSVKTSNINNILPRPKKKPIHYKKKFMEQIGER